jgi:UDP-N-acetylmuramate--alanine ligase
MFLGKTRRIHFIGIGGSGMSGIAEVLINQGYEVTGSDLAKSPVTEYLEKVGASISFGHKAENIGEAQVVVTSTAVKANNVEVHAAKEKMVPVIPRAEMLAELMRLKHGIAIAGTHGKTTTTSLVATVLAEGKLDPTVIIGGKLKSIGSNAKLGQSEFIVAEADESDGSFLHLSPAIAVVTTIDKEHMDFYKTMDNLKNNFLIFLNRIPFYGTSILCLDDHNIQSLIPKLEKRFVTYGLASQADFTARNITTDGLQTHFDVCFQGKELGRIHSAIHGRHNTLNTLAAIAVGMEMNLTFDVVAEALKGFSGVHRRFEITHDTSELIVVDDYGHHPTEVEVTLRTAKEVWPQRKLIAVFQPHRYSRTQLLMKEFCSAFNDADHLIVTGIHPGGEDPIEGVSGNQLAEGVKKFGHKKVEFIEDKKEAHEHLLNITQPGDVLITLGAGNVWEMGRDFLANLPERFR